VCVGVCDDLFLIVIIYIYVCVKCASGVATRTVERSYFVTVVIKDSVQDVSSRILALTQCRRFWELILGHVSSVMLVFSHHLP
jgi:hypothetical protein